jgi:hypothetical protein
MTNLDERSAVSVLALDIGEARQCIYRLELGVPWLRPVPYRSPMSIFENI